MARIQNEIGLAGALHHLVEVGDKDLCRVPRLALSPKVWIVGCQDSMFDVLLQLQHVRTCILR